MYSKYCGQITFCPGANQEQSPSSHIFVKILRKKQLSVVYFIDKEEGLIHNAQTYEGSHHHQKPIFVFVA